MIARIWKGQTRLAQSDRYLDYLLTTGVHDLQMTEGNQGVYVLRRIEDGQAEFTFISLWESLEAVRRFAGEEIDRAVYYPEDCDYLLALDPKVAHYEILVAPGTGLVETD